MWESAKKPDCTALIVKKETKHDRTITQSLLSFLHFAKARMNKTIGIKSELVAI